MPYSEPYAKRTSHGMILGENGEKMSKSRGNVVNPDEVIDEFGADTLRLYEMFIGDFEKAAPWQTNGVKGCRRFVERVWKLQELVNGEQGYSKELLHAMHRTVKKVSYDYENLKGNTAIAALMELLNEMYQKGSVTADEFKTFLILLNPAAPHVTEELWQTMGYEGYVFEQKWPTYEEALTVESEIQLAIQFCGRTKGTVSVPKDATQEDVKAAVMADPRLASQLEGKTVIKEIFVPGRIYNLVIK